MRIALLSYRSKTHCGGQGVYVRHLSRGLVELGHQVEVFSGQPYPEILDPRVRLTGVPSLDLYREPDPFRVPHPREIRDRIDALELATMWTGGFPEPRTFSLRAARLLAVHPLRAADALQLAAALLWCEEQPHAEGFVSLDVKLREAAFKEGFTVRPD